MHALYLKAKVFATVAAPELEVQLNKWISENQHIVIEKIIYNAFSQTEASNLHCALLFYRNPADGPGRSPYTRG